MKKSVLALALAFGVTTAFAQDLTSKKGEPILPEAGDWGLGIDATPILGYAKTFIGTSNGTNTLSWGSLTTPLTITGKYFADEKTAYRGGVNLGFGSQSWTNIVTDDASTATPPATKEDKKTSSGSTIGLSGGIEMRKGKTRLQGYYGGELGLAIYGGSSDKYTYGNAFSTSNPSPTSTTNWTPGSMASGPVASRTTASKTGSTFIFGLRGFIGAEYFVFPKMSIGGEFGWGLGFTSTGEGSSTTESWNGTGTTTTTNKTGKSSSFGLGADTKNTVLGSSGAIRFNMYF